MPPITPCSSGNSPTMRGRQVGLEQEGRARAARRRSRREPDRAASVRGQRARPASPCRANEPELSGGTRAASRPGRELRRAAACGPAAKKNAASARRAPITHSLPWRTSALGVVAAVASRPGSTAPRVPSSRSSTRHFWWWRSVVISTSSGSSRKRGVDARRAQRPGTRRARRARPAARRRGGPRSRPRPRAAPPRPRARRAAPSGSTTTPRARQRLAVAVRPATRELDRPRRDARGGRSVVRPEATPKSSNGTRSRLGRRAARRRRGRGRTNGVLARAPSASSSGSAAPATTRGTSSARISEVGRPRSARVAATTSPLGPLTIRSSSTATAVRLAKPSAAGGRRAVAARRRRRAGGPVTSLARGPAAARAGRRRTTTSRRTRGQRTHRGAARGRPRRGSLPKRLGELLRAPRQRVGRDLLGDGARAGTVAISRSRLLERIAEREAEPLALRDVRLGARAPRCAGRGR